MLFFTLATMQFGIAIGVRARPGTWTNPFLLAGVATAFLLQLAAIYLPFLRDLLGTAPLSATEVAVGSALSLVGYAATRYVRAVHPGRALRRRPAPR